MHKKQRQADARTRNELQAMGWIVIVVPWGEVRDHPKRVYEQIRLALETRGYQRYPTQEVQR
jgi:very-short-patch-repair endonuclease